MMEREAINRTDDVKSAIRDYPRMRYIYDNSPDVAKEVHEAMISPGKTQPSELPAVQSSSEVDGKIPRLIDRLDSLQQQYYDAMLFISWFEPAWLHLQAVEREVLTEFYMSGNLRSGATYRLMSSLHKSAAWVDYNRRRSLRRLERHLY